MMTSQHKAWRESCGFNLDDIEWKAWAAVHIWHPLFGQFRSFSTCRCGQMHPVWDGLNLEVGTDFWFVCRPGDDYLSRARFEEVVDLIAYSIPPDEVANMSIHLLSQDLVINVNNMVMTQIHEQLFPEVSETEKRFAKMVAYAIKQAEFAHSETRRPPNGKYN